MSFDQQAWFLAAAVVLAAVVLGSLARVVAGRRLAALFARTPGDLDDRILAAVRGHLPFWFLVGGVAIAGRIAPLSSQAIGAVDRLCAAALALSLTLAAARLGVSLLERYTRKAGASVATTSLAQNVLRACVFVCGAMLILANLGVSITPLLTTLGIGSLAVALALQPTLSNLFAGMHLAMARPIRVGDFVELEGGKQGYIDDIGWRATRLRELPNNLLVVPNARLAEMIMINYNLPETEQAALVQVGVSYASNLEEVERVTKEVGREVLRDIEGGVEQFEPFIRYHTFGDSSIGFTVILRVRGFVDRFLVMHEFIKRLKSRYDREGIEIPFPQRVVHGSIGSLAPARPSAARVSS